MIHPRICSDLPDSLQDLFFASPIRLGRIAFRNYYVHRLSLYSTNKKVVLEPN